MHRRRFLARLAILIGATFGLACTNERKKALLAELRGILTRRHAVEIGRAYFRHPLAETNGERLGELIFSDMRWDTLWSSDLRQVLARRVRRDYREGRTIQIEGWMLSLTEVRVCALAAFDHRG